MTPPSTVAMRSSSRPEGWRMDRRATSRASEPPACFGRSRWSISRIELGFVDMVWLGSASDGDLETTMAQGGEALPHLLLQGVVDLGHCKPCANFSYTIEHMAPRGDDHGIAPCFAAALVHSALRGRNDVAEVLDRSRSNQGFPVRSARCSGERGRQTQDLRAFREQMTKELGEAHVVADRKPDAAERRRHDDRFAARRDRGGLVIAFLAIR